MNTAIWWIRRDIRLENNVALAAALDHAERVVPVFVIDPELLASPYVSQQRFAFLLGGLRELDESLRKRGSRLVVRRGPPLRELSRIVRETGAESIYCEQDVSPYSRKRDRKLRDSLPLKSLWGLSYLSPSQVLKPDDSPYTQFSAYRRTWLREAVRRSTSVWKPPSRLPDIGRVPSDRLPDVRARDDSLFPPGEREARRRLSRFSKRIHSYAEVRNRLDLEGTSRLSPYFRFGNLSAQRAVSAAFDAIDDAAGKGEMKGAEAWLAELIWREFYISVLWHFPEARNRSFRGEGRFMHWRDDEDDYAAWCEGRTGYPAVDAGMRELSRTGFMHNRARMITASFLTKHLLIDWRRGERWFMQHLVDGDPAANNGGWQWTAGTGTDAAPYFRVFNPILQGKRFDPDGRYVKRWLPELRARPRASVHEPDRPIVSHTEARVRALRAFQEARKRARTSRRDEPDRND
ncbi:MAG TPA: deoxyribodipyrimidine photo-lyase [Vicinamibacteria bacterium]|nr:deoxyribodipyrimidine photo-lyase [Vicinamibacteria bacterium]